MVLQPQDAADEPHRERHRGGLVLAVGLVDLVGEAAIDAVLLHLAVGGVVGLGDGLVDLGVGPGQERERVELGLERRVAAFGSGAAVSGSWLAGGGLEGSFDADRLSARAEAGLFRFQPLDGRDATIGEARARIGTPLVASSDA